MAWLAAKGFQNSRCLTPNRLSLASIPRDLMLASRQPCSLTPPIHPRPKKNRFQLETRDTRIEYLLYPNRPHEVRPDVRQATYAVEQAEWIATQKTAVLGTTSSPLRDTSGPTTCQRETTKRLNRLERSTPDMKCNSDAEDKYQAMTLIIHITVQDFRPLNVFYRTLVLSHSVHQVTGGSQAPSQDKYQAAVQDDRNVVLRSLPRESLLLPLMTIPPMLNHDERFFMLLKMPQTRMMTSSQV